MKKILILGSTGSIGTNALELIRNNTDLFNDGGGRNGTERIVYFYKDDFLARRVPYSEDGVKALKEYITNIRKAESNY